MIYTPENSANGASVYDVDTQKKIDNVMEIDIEKAEVTCALHPFRLNPAGDCIETKTMKFRSIYPIFDGKPWPWLFHCYGREVTA